MKTNITPCLWFNTEAEDAARFYTGIFKDSKITEISYYSDAGQEHHGHAPGTVMTVAFELKGQTFTALNGGPCFKINEAISFQIGCETQDEIDDYWARLTDGGPVEAQQCGWVKDKFGVSWQIVPVILTELLTDADTAKARRAMQAMLQMRKLDIAALRKAYEG